MSMNIVNHSVYFYYIHALRSCRTHHSTSGITFMQNILQVERLLFFHRHHILNTWSEIFNDYCPAYIVVVLRVFLNKIFPSFGLNKRKLNATNNIHSSNNPLSDKENDHYHKGIKQNCDVLALSVNLPLVFFFFLHQKRPTMDGFIYETLYFMKQKRISLIFSKT